MTPDQHPRTAGVQLHPTSLPSGRLDDDAYAFVDWLAAAGQSWWQMLPLGPPDRYGSPYKAHSAFAAWPGLLADPDAPVSDDEAAAFRERESYWIEGWIESNPTRPRGALEDQVRFDREWSALRAYAARARRAAHRRRADLRRPRRRRPPDLAGAVPARAAGGRAARRVHRQGPALGQPDLRLARAAPPPLPVVGRAAATHVRDGRHDADRPLPRVRRLLGGAGGCARRRRRPLDPRAGGGAVPGGGARARRARRHRRGPRRHHRAGRAAAPVAGLPRHGRAPVRLRRHELARTIPTTTRSTASSTPARTTTTRRAAGGRRLPTPRVRTRTGPSSAAGVEADDPWWSLIRLAHKSPAELAMVQLQDVLGLGSEARMNMPGTATGSWRWRLEPGALTEESAARLRASTEAAGR